MLDITYDTSLHPVITILLAGLVILIGVNDDYLLKEYRKKYLMVMYFIITTLNILVNKNGYSIIGVLFINLGIFLALSFIAAINVSYSEVVLEKRMACLDLLVLKFFEWMFSVRTYVFLVYSLLIIIVINFYNFFVENDFSPLFINSYSILSFILLLIYIARHLLKNANDIFRFKNYDEVSSVFSKKVGNFNEKYSIKKSKSDVEFDINIIVLMGFVVFMEDKDFFSRKTFFYSPIPVLKRKTKSFIEQKNVRKLCSRVKNGFRIHATLPQQLIRRISLKENAYTISTRYRRKLFIEHVYMHYFFKYFKNHRLQYLGSLTRESKEYKDDFYKVEMLKAYYEEVHKLTDSREELIKSMTRNSALASETYYMQFEIYLKSYLKDEYMTTIAKNYYHWYHEGRIPENANNEKQLLSHLSQEI